MIPEPSTYGWIDGPHNLCRIVCRFDPGTTNRRFPWVFIVSWQSLWPRLVLRLNSLFGSCFCSLQEARNSAKPGVCPHFFFNSLNSVFSRVSLQGFFFFTIVRMSHQSSPRLLGLISKTNRQRLLSLRLPLHEMLMVKMAALLQKALTDRFPWGSCDIPPSLVRWSSTHENGPCFMKKMDWGVNGSTAGAHRALSLPAIIITGVKQEKTCGKSEWTLNTQKVHGQPLFFGFKSRKSDFLKPFHSLNVDPSPKTGCQIPLFLISSQAFSYMGRYLRLGFYTVVSTSSGTLGALPLTCRIQHSTEPVCL